MPAFTARLKAFATEIAFASSAIAYLLQALGYSETCTGGDTDGFYVGAMFSAPLLLLSILILSSKVFRATTRERLAKDAVWGTAVLSIVVLLLYMNRSLAWGVLATGETPCFITYDFTDYRLPPLFSGEYEPTHVVIGFIYGVMPVLLALLAVANLLKNILQR